LEILKFMYTDKIEVSGMNCIGVLIYSLLFGLGLLASNCRLLVKENLNENNVSQVLEVSEVYSDIILKRYVNLIIKKVC
jgi:hypothetical protein